MKYLTLVWAGLWRRKTRTILTMLSIVAAFLLFGLLHGVNRGLTDVVEDLDGNRLFTAGKYSPLEGMPIAHMRRIAAVPGVTDIAPWVYFGGYYRDRRNAVGVFATDPQALFRLYREFKMPPEQLEAMRRVRTGALITTQLAARYGWSVGDIVPIGTSIWTDRAGRSVYQFEIVGIYDRGNAPVNGFLINYDYLDESRRFGTGTAHNYIIGIDDPRRADELSGAVDALFANSTHETRTQTDRAYLASTLKQLADISFIVNSVVGAVFFTLLLLTGTTMMQSVRERTPELAVLKTLGFTDGAVSALVVCESVTLCAGSAAIGLALARLAFGPLAAAIGNVSMPATVLVSGMGIALALAVASGLPPALRAGRLNVVDALAGR